MEYPRCGTCGAAELLLDRADVDRERTDVERDADRDADVRLMPSGERCSKSITNATLVEEADGAATLMEPD